MIDNPLIKNFCNNKLRVCADAQGTALLTSRAMLEHAAADGILALLEKADADEVIDDGSASDGRTPMTVGMIRNYIANTAGYLGQATTRPDEKSYTLMEQVLYVAVNEQTRI